MLGDGGAADISVHGEGSEQVNVYTYFGTVICRSSGINEEISNRLDKAATAFGSMYKIWKSTNMSLKTKLSLYNSNVVSIVLYGSECWPMTVVNTKRIDAFDSKCLRRIMGVNCEDEVNNSKIREPTKHVELSTKIKRRRLQWFGHVCRMESNKIECAVLFDNHTVVKRNKGRSKETWY